MNNFYEKRSAEFEGKNVAPSMQTLEGTDDTSKPIQIQQYIPEPETTVKPSVANQELNDKVEIFDLQQSANHALRLVDDVVLKNYLTQLSNLQVVPFEGEPSLNDTIIYKINKMV